MQSNDLESKRIECSKSILCELKSSSVASDCRAHAAAFDRIISEYQPMIEGKRMSLTVFAELIALNGSIELTLLEEDQRAHLLVVGGLVILEPLKQCFKDRILLEENSVHYQEEHESALRGLESIEGSRSFRVGRAMTAIPRRIKRFVS